MGSASHMRAPRSTEIGMETIFSTLLLRKAKVKSTSSPLSSRTASQMYKQSILHSAAACSRSRLLRKLQLRLRLRRNVILNAYEVRQDTGGIE